MMGGLVEDRPLLADSSPWVSHIAIYLASRGTAITTKHPWKDMLPYRENVSLRKEGQVCLLASITEIILSSHPRSGTLPVRH